MPIKTVKSIPLEIGGLALDAEHLIIGSQVRLEVMLEAGVEVMVEVTMQVMLEVTMEVMMEAAWIASWMVTSTIGWQPQHLGCLQLVSAGGSKERGMQGWEFDLSIFSIFKKYRPSIF